MQCCNDLNSLVADVNAKVAALAQATAFGTSRRLALQNSLQALSAATTTTPAAS